MSTPQPVQDILGQSAPDSHGSWLKGQPWDDPSSDVNRQVLLQGGTRQTPTTEVQPETQTNWCWRLKTDSGRQRTGTEYRTGVLLLGHGVLAESIVLHLQDSPRLRLVGWLDHDRSNGQPVSHDDSELDLDLAGQSWLVDAARRQGASVIVVAVRDRRVVLPLEQLLACRLEGIDVLDGTAFFERAGRKIPLAGLQPDYLVFNDGFHWPPRLAKRALDIVLSAIGLLITLPFFVLLPLVIKGTSSGPVFYRQERAGLNGRRFTILKFRSMYDKAEQVGCPVWAQEQDPRITPIGRFMRTYRLDELPQMINVLRGDMSFVGPRPERPEFVALLAREIPFYALRLSVKPGITGWAQIMFRYGATVQDAAEKLQYDLYYIKHMSIALDSLIALKTIRTVLLQSGAR